MYGKIYYSSTTIEKTTEVLFEGPCLRIGESAGFTLKLINNGTSIQNFTLWFSCRPQISISSEEVSISETIDGYLLSTLSYQTFDLFPGQTKIYNLEITCNNIIGGNFDIDSIAYFIQQFSPDKIALIGNVPEELDAILQMRA